MRARAAAVVGIGQTEYSKHLGFDETEARRMYAGSDFLLMPSRFEPCGLTQLCGLRYGCVPVVARVGGLADTVIDANLAALNAGVATGFQFAPVDAPGLASAIRRAVGLFRSRDWPAPLFKVPGNEVNHR